MIVMVEVEAMKAENALRLIRKEYPSYRENDFLNLADKLTNILNQPE